MNTCGYIMKLSVFIRDCRNGYLIDYDGFGHYSDGKTETNVVVMPSHIIKGNINHKFSHVAWYNR